MGDNAQPRPRVVIAGGGVAALEAALALRALGGDRIDVEMLSPRGEFVYRSFAIAGPDCPTGIRHDLAALAEWIGVSFRPGGVVAVDGAARRIACQDGEWIRFDRLLVATGARLLPGVPGAITFWGALDEGGVDWAVRRLRAGILRDVVVTMPEGPGWVLPAYELALFAAGVLARSGIEDARVALATPEEAPLRALGLPACKRMTRALGWSGVEVVAGRRPLGFDGECLWFDRGDPIETGAVISLPRFEGHRIDGFETDGSGLLRVDADCRVVGETGVFAAGDATAAAVKRTGAATREADVAVSAIARALGHEVEAVPLPLGLDLDGRVEGRYLTPFLAALDGGERQVFAAG